MAGRPLGIRAPDGSSRAWIRIETQFYQRRCAPFTPFAKTGCFRPITSHPGHCRGRDGIVIITRPRDHRNRHSAGDAAPVPPAVELGKVVRSHQPDKPPFRPAVTQGAQCIDGVRRAEPPFQCCDPDRRPARLSTCGPDPGSKRCHTCFRLQRIAGRHQPPHFIQAERPHCEQGDPAMAAMSRVEAAAQKARARATAAQGRVCPVPRTCHL